MDDQQKTSTATTPHRMEDSKPDAQKAPAISSDKSRRRRKVVLIVIGIVLAIGIVAGVVYGMFFYVSKADYKSAEQQATTALAAYHKADDTMAAYSATVDDVTATDASIASEKAGYVSARNEYVAAVHTLANMRALKDGKVKAAYDTFATKNATAMVNSDSIADALPTIRALVVQCNDADMNGSDTSNLSTIASVWNTAFAGCASAIKQVSTVKNADVATMGKKLQGNFDEMHTDIAAIQAAYIAKDEVAFAKAYTAYTNAGTAYSSDDSLKNIQQHQDRFAPLSELNALLTAIRAQE